MSCVVRLILDLFWSVLYSLQVSLFCDRLWCKKIRITNTYQSAVLAVRLYLNKSINTDKHSLRAKGTQYKWSAQCEKRLASWRLTSINKTFWLGATVCQLVYRRPELTHIKIVEPVVKSAITSTVKLFTLILNCVCILIYSWLNCCFQQFDTFPWFIDWN